MKNVRTKISKTERIEIWCTKVFKEMINEIAVQNDLTVSQLIEVICTDKIINDLKWKSSDNLKVVSREITAYSESPVANRSDYEREIWRMLNEGKTPTESARWLNENGFKPQRGDSFTMNSVHSIRQRLKRKSS